MQYRPIEGYKEQLAQLHELIDQAYPDATVLLREATTICELDLSGTEVNLTCFAFRLQISTQRQYRHEEDGPIQQHDAARVRKYRFPISHHVSVLFPHTSRRFLMPVY